MSTKISVCFIIIEVMDKESDSTTPAGTSSMQGKFYYYVRLCH